jgi:DHA3 family macrolide efflux protein-like MFS transporter
MTQPKRSMSRNFLLLWQGQAVSQVGTQLFQVIAILCLKQATESATIIGLFLMAYAIPNVILGPIGGVLADRYSRRRILIVGDFSRGGILALLAIVLALHAHSTGFLIGLLLLYSAVEGTVTSLWQPSGIAMIPDLVSSEDLSGANSLMQGSFQICTVVAQAFAGILFRVLGTPVLMIIDASTYLYAAISDSLLVLPKSAQASAHPLEKSKPIRTELFEALRYVHMRTGMRTVFYTMTLFQLLMVPMVILFPFYVDQQLRAGPQWYGFLLAASGFGSLAGYAVGGGARVSAEAASRMILVATLAMSLLLLSLAAVSSPWIALLLVAAVGLTSGFNAIRLMTILQMAIPSEIRGRVFGVLMTITQGLAPFAMALTGVLADLAKRNIAEIYLGCGAAAAILSLNIILRPDCRGFLAGQYSRLEASAAVPGD